MPLAPPSFGAVTPASTALQVADSVTVQWMPVSRNGVKPPLVAPVTPRFICLSQVNVQLGPPTILQPEHVNVMFPLVLSTGDAAAVGPEKNSGNAPDALDHVAVIVHVVIATFLPLKLSCMPVVDVSVFAPVGDTVTVEATACPAPITINNTTSSEVRAERRGMGLLQTAVTVVVGEVWNRGRSPDTMSAAGPVGKIDAEQVELTTARFWPSALSTN